MIANPQYPQKSLYIIGANIIELLLSNTSPSIGALALHDNYEIIYGDISYPYFIYSLDWLFIIGAICTDKHGDLELCN